MTILSYADLLLALLLSGAFSGGSLAYLKFSIPQLTRMKDAGDKNAEVVLRLRLAGKKNLLHVTILVSNTFVNCYVPMRLESIGNGLLVISLSTAAIFLFGELIPQIICNRHPLKTGRFLAPVMYFFLYATYLISWPLGRIIFSILGEEVDKPVSAKEFKLIITQMEDHPESDIDELEENLVKNALSLDEKTVREIMTPVEKIKALSIDTTLSKDQQRYIKAMGISTIPVYKESLDNIVGVLHVQELIAIDEDTKLEELYSEAKFGIPTDMRLDDAVEKVIKNPHQMEIVLSSGKVMGLVTLEDFIEELLGQEIEDVQDIQLRIKAAKSIKRKTTKRVKKA